MTKAVSIVPPHTTRIYGPGQVCLDSEAGDLVLVRHTGFMAKGIRAFERLRVPKQFCWTNHAAIVLTGGPNARISEESASGDVSSALGAMDAQTYAVIHFSADDAQREAVVYFASWALGHGYGYASIVADAWNALTGWELGLGFGNRMVCSTQSTRALERLGLIPDRTPYAVTPAHLALYTGTVLPTPLLSTLSGKKD